MGGTTARCCMAALFAGMTNQTARSCRVGGAGRGPSVADWAVFRTVFGLRDREVAFRPGVSEAAFSTHLSVHSDRLSLGTVFGL